jgi:hypothetical protein
MTEVVSVQNEVINWTVSEGILNYFFPFEVKLAFNFLR